MDITVQELYSFLEKLIAEGKGGYGVFCEGGSVPLGVFDDSVDDERKKIVL